VISGLQRIFTRRLLATVLLWAVLIVLALATLSPSHAWLGKRETVFRIRAPSFSPDSKLLVMELLYTDKKAVLAIWHIEDERLNLLPTAPKGRAWITPSFSLDGAHVMFADCNVKNSVCHVAKVELDGSNYQRLTISENADYPAIDKPSYSPDGLKILFARKTNFIGDSDIFELNLATGAETRLTHFDLSMIINLRYLDDGRNFIFQGYGPKDSDIKVYDALYQANYIFIMRPDQGYDYRPAFTHGDNSSQPSVSADGDKILFKSFTDDYEYLVVRSGSENNRIIEKKEIIEYAVLSPDGKTVFFSTEVERAPKFRPTSKKPKYTFWLVNTDGSNMREIRFPD